MAAFELANLGIGLLPIGFLGLNTFGRIDKDRPVKHGWDRGSRINHLLSGLHRSRGIGPQWGRYSGLGQGGCAGNCKEPKQPSPKGVTNLQGKFSKR